MVDVSDKPPTARRAVAEAIVGLAPETLSLVIDESGPKGDVLTVAELAGVLAAKRTAELIPLCHPLPLTDVLVEATPDRAGSLIRIRAEAATTAPTGVEMEALTAAAVAALTVYDMVKGVERGVEIRTVRLVEKAGGRSGHWRRPPDDAAERPAAAPRPARSAGRVRARTPKRTGRQGRGST